VTAPRRHIVLTPRLDGADGISAVSRVALHALAEDGTPVEVLSLDAEGERALVELRLPRGVQSRCAEASRVRFGLWGAAAALRGSGAHVLAMHARLAPAALPLVLRGARLSVFIHGVEAWRPLGRLVTRALRRASVVVANSAYTAARFGECNAGLATNVKVCHLGVGPGMAPAPEVVRPGYALIVGRISAEERYKGHDQLIEVWPRLLQRVEAARLVVVGDGDDRARLESRVTENGLGGAVRFLGRVSEAELQALYRDAAFLAFPSSGEGFGIVLLEAMRAGRACLAGRGAAEEVVVDGVTGVIVDPRDPKDLHQALVRLFGDAAGRVRLGAAGAARFAERFTALQFQARLRAALGLAAAPPSGAVASGGARPA
jgi:glycosyltransferase involved in cell wall biosynthesis